MEQEKQEIELREISRNDYLKSLPKDENGMPIINHEEFDELSYHNGWEQEFTEYLFDVGLVEARDFDEFYDITD